MLFQARESAFERKLTELREAQRAVDRDITAGLSAIAVLLKGCVEAVTGLADIADGALHVAAGALGEDATEPVLRARARVDEARQVAAAGLATVQGHLATIQQHFSTE